MTCRTTESLGTYLLGAVDARERAAVEAHLAVCAACRTTLQGCYGKNSAMKACRGSNRESAKMMTSIGKRLSAVVLLLLATERGAARARAVADAGARRRPCR